MKRLFLFLLFVLLLGMAGGNAYAQGLGRLVFLLLISGSYNVARSCSGVSKNSMRERSAGVSIFVAT